MADEKEAKPESKDEVALEMMKFIAVTTGYGKGNAQRRGSREKARAARRSMQRHYSNCSSVAVRCIQTS
jgi:hypothetical protein